VSEIGSTLTVSPTSYDAYIWNDGTTGFSIVADAFRPILVHSRKEGCFKNSYGGSNRTPYPTPEIIGNLFTCFFSNTTV